MEAFIVAIIFVTALVLGSPHHQDESEQSQTINSSLSRDQLVEDGGSVSVCDPSHHSVVLRDLSKPVEHQVNDDGY
ncbi:MAG: hypothetical protein GKR95_03500 [Gammaproteobacteria bacterium]|nr:hypothetical protein [Gammaproteobacteria bacterium]